jgi:OHCU decarboxylase
MDDGTRAVAKLNALEDAGARDVFLRCCGSTRWAHEMAALRPFKDAGVVKEQADAIWLRLDPADWLEAFAAHPRIGESTSREQAGMDSATGSVRQRLALANRQYEERFGFIYLVCATGKTADELLAIVERRLTGTREQEVLIAAEEQQKITRLRIDALLRDADLKLPT